MTYLFDPDAPRNCWATIVVGQLFGLLPFRGCLLVMFGSLLTTLASRTWWSLAVCGFALLCWCTSSGMIMYEEFSNKPDSLMCRQNLSTSLTSANNATFLVGFASLTVPIIAILVKNMRSAKMTGVSSGVRRVYFLQIGFLFLFTTVYLLVSIGGWFWKDFYSIIYGFIWSDYVYLLGVYMWLLPELGSGSSTITTRQASQSVAAKQEQRKSLLAAGQNPPKRIVEDVEDNSV
ncbi:hypothetical protein HKX48_007808 [Thoreauomyces humboldtii]|nr:hypothetical protein HKX48_007808 [Thoreauomyces humboldtii]